MKWYPQHSILFVSIVTYFPMRPGRGFKAGCFLLLAVTMTNAFAENPSTLRSPDEWLLFYPSVYPEGEWSADWLGAEDTWFESIDGTRLHGWWFSHTAPRGVLLYLHGNGGNLSHRGWLMAQLRDQLQLSIFIPDYRGYGRSEGTPTVSGALADARAARRVAAEMAGVEESEVVLQGRSLGGAIAVQLAAELAPPLLVLESTFDSLRNVARAHYGFLAFAVPAGKLDSSATIGEYHGPLLQSHGDADRIIPIESGRALYEAAPGQKSFFLVPGGGHNQPQPAEWYQKLKDAISQAGRGVESPYSLK